MPPMEDIKEKIDINPIYPEFIHQATSMERRKAHPASDEFVIRRARIYKSLGPRDDRLQVQIIPDMMGLDEAEMDNLPRYPPFIKGTVIQGKSIKEDGDKAEDVWVVCTPDYQVGYVLGKSNPFGDNTEKPKYPRSYNYDAVKKYMNGRRILPEDFDYSHSDVVHWVSTDQGGMIELYNYLTGDWLLMNSSGSIISVQQKRIFIRVGTPPDPPEAGPAAFSAMTMTESEVNFKCPNFVVDAQKVVLGKHSLQAAMMPAGAVLGGENGAIVIPNEIVYM